MEQISDKQVKINFEDIDKLELEFDKKVGLTIFWDDVKYEFLMDLRKKSKKLIIVGSGALGVRNFDRKRPYIDRHSWNFKQSTIYYHDPTYYIDDSITGGWGFGSKNNHYLKKISLILDLIIKKLDVPYQNVIFYGSSAGGFISLVLSTYIKGTLCLADIPQIYVNRYKTKLKQLDGWRDLKEQCDNELTDEEFLDKYKYRLDVVEIIKKEEYVPNAYLVLDCSVDLDFNTQYMPFFKALNELPFTETSNNIKLIISGRQKGHVPLEKNETIELINDLLERNNADDEISSAFSKSTNVNINSVLTKLEKYNTARIDVSLSGEDSNLEIISIDDYITITSAPWLKDAYGLVITNKNNTIDFKVKCSKKGTFSIKLRGINNKVNGEYSPIYIDYTKFIVNDNEILEKNRIVDHNHPVSFDKPVEEEEIISVHIEWLPF